MNFGYSAGDHFAILPALNLSLFACAILLFHPLVPPGKRRWLLLFLLPAFLLTGSQLWRQQHELTLQGAEAFTGFGGAILIDRFSLFFNWLFVGTAALVCLSSYRYFQVEQEHHPEYYALVLLACTGAYFLATGVDLITLFVGLELMAISFYVLTGFLRRSARSNEAAIKYLLLGAFSSALLAYGFSMLYGIAGSTLLSEIAVAVAKRPPNDPWLILAIVTTGSGLLFKVASAPFHMWAPDAYEGAPAPVTIFLAAGSKVASLALLLRIFLVPLAEARDLWEPLILVAAVASLIIGNLAALTQTNIKRLLGYSSIAHAGYMLLGLLTGNEAGLKGIAVYTAAYVFMTIGSFLVVVALRRQEILGEDLQDLRGMGRHNPGLALLIVVFLLSLAGLPPTAGFLGKYYIFLSLLETGHITLAIVGALFVAISLYFYFRIVKSMFLLAEVEGEPGIATRLPQMTWGVRIALATSAIITLLGGVYPEPFLRLVEGALLR